MKSLVEKVTFFINGLAVLFALIWMFVLAYERNYLSFGMLAVIVFPAFRDCVTYVRSDQ